MCVYSVKRTSKVKENSLSFERKKKNLPQHDAVLPINFIIIGYIVCCERVHKHIIYASFNVVLVEVEAVMCWKCRENVRSKKKKKEEEDLKNQTSRNRRTVCWWPVKPVV